MNNMDMSGWVIKQALLGGQDFVKQGIKKNLEPVRRLVANLESIRQDLDNGVSIREAGHQLRPEKKDVFRIGQGDRKLKESRLYVYFYIEGKNIVLLNIGTKDRQAEDIAKAIEIKDHFLETGEAIDFGSKS